jgi:nitroreductase
METMHAFIELVRARRSIRKYAPRPVEQKKIDLLVEAVLRAPTSHGSQPWEFVVVTESERIARLSEAKPHGSAFLKNAPLAFVVCADTATSDIWVEDASIAATFLQLAAASLGLGSCWIQIRLRDHDSQHSASAYVADVLGLREGLEVETIIAMGYPAEEKAPRPADALPYAKISRERYGASLPKA